jgi:hypothetical protein
MRRRAHLSRRRLALLAACTAAMAGPPTAAWAAILGEYFGHVKGDPAAEVSFDIKRVDGVRKVRGFFVFNAAYKCEVGADGRSEGMALKKGLRVHADGSFAGEGEVVILLGDPSGKVTGELDHGEAKGTFRIKGELGGPGTDCKTGLQKWKASKSPPGRAAG